MGVPTSRKQESEKSEYRSRAAGESDSGIILARPQPIFSPPRDDLLSATKNGGQNIDK